jgi:hypothetical protein
VVTATNRLGALPEEKIAEIAKASNFDRSFTPEVHAIHHMKFMETF